MVLWEVTMYNPTKIIDMGFNVEQLKKMAKKPSEEIIKAAEYRRKNRNWLNLSGEIALAVHYYLRTEHITQQALAERMGVSPAYVAKVMKGQENLTLETISKIQEALGEKLISTICPYKAKYSFMVTVPSTRINLTDFNNNSLTFDYKVKENMDFSPIYSEKIA